MRGAKSYGGGAIARRKVVQQLARMPQCRCRRHLPAIDDETNRRRAPERCGNAVTPTARLGDCHAVDGLNPLTAQSNVRTASPTSMRRSAWARTVRLAHLPLTRQSHAGRQISPDRPSRRLHGFSICRFVGPAGWPGVGGQLHSFYNLPSASSGTQHEFTSE